MLRALVGILVLLVLSSSRCQAQTRHLRTLHPTQIWRQIGDALTLQTPESQDFSRSVLQGSARPSYLGKLAEEKEYDLMTVGHCINDDLYITSRSECENAAVRLGLDDITAGNNHHPENPYGCYYKLSARRLYYGVLGGHKDTDTDRVSICMQAAYRLEKLDRCFNVKCPIAPGSCLLTGECEDGKCTYHKFKPDGSLCDDNVAATFGDHCIAGVCKGIDLCAPVTCPSESVCKHAARCRHGDCMHTNKPDGTNCDDGRQGTTGDHCRAGICGGEADYALMSVGTCASDDLFIESARACETAAHRLHLSDVTAGSNHHRENPYGCYYKRSTQRLYFGMTGGKHDTDDDRVSICMKDKSDTIVALDPTQSLTWLWKEAERKAGRTVSASSSSSGPTAVHCAKEGQTCNCYGQVTFGHGARWKVRTSTGSIRCSNKIFGDPMPFFSKACFCNPRRPPAIQ